MLGTKVGRELEVVAGFGVWGKHLGQWYQLKYVEQRPKC